MTESESVALPFGDTPTTDVIIRHENHFVSTFFEKNIKKHKKRENPKITRKTRKTVPEPAWTREAGSDIIGEYKR